MSPWTASTPVRHLPDRIGAVCPDALPSLPAGVWITRIVNSKLTVPAGSSLWDQRAFRACAFEERRHRRETRAMSSTSHSAPFDLHGQVAIVTGANHGIGAATAGVGARFVPSAGSR